MYTFRKSKRKNKKYDVFKNNKYLVSFGDSRYQQYFDKIGVYTRLNHNDNKRRSNYYSRFGRNPKYESAMWFSHKYLW